MSQNVTNSSQKDKDRRYERESYHQPTTAIPPSHFSYHMSGITTSKQAPRAHSSKQLTSTHGATSRSVLSAGDGVIPTNNFNQSKRSVVSTHEENLKLSTAYQPNYSNQVFVDQVLNESAKKKSSQSQSKYKSYD